MFNLKLLEVTVREKGSDGRGQFCCVAPGEFYVADTTGLWHLSKVCSMQHSGSSFLWVSIVRI